MNTINLRTIIGASVLALALTACGSNPSSSSFSSNQAMRAQTVQMGEVVALRDVTIQSGNSGVGTATGAALGGIAGSTLGNGNRANAAGAIGGAVAGGLAGNAIASGGNRAGVEVTVRLDSGRTIAVVQPGNSGEFRVGETVRVASDGNTTRISR